MFKAVPEEIQWFQGDFSESDKFKKVKVLLRDIENSFVSLYQLIQFYPDSVSMILEVVKDQFPDSYERLEQLNRQIGLSNVGPTDLKMFLRRLLN